jgi:hypothetical protein
MRMYYTTIVGYLWLEVTLAALRGLEPYEVLQALGNRRRHPVPGRSEQGVQVLTIWARTTAARPTRHRRPPRIPGAHPGSREGDAAIIRQAEGVLDKFLRKRILSTSAHEGNQWVRRRGVISYELDLALAVPQKHAGFRPHCGRGSGTSDASEADMHMTP